MRASVVCRLAAPGAKARAEAAATAAAKKRALKGGETPMTGTMKSIADLVRPVRPPAPHSEAEQKRLRALMIRYGKLKWEHHRQSEIKVNAFLRAKWAAIDALPHARKVEALTTKAPPFPLNRPLFTETPPIPGFNAGDLTKPS